jgi:serine/threonine protein kinase
MTQGLPPIDSASSLSSRFEPIGPVDRGGMGEIWLAIDHQFERYVAIKEILPDVVQDPQYHRRFLNEARITARLNHPGIIPVYSKGKHADGRPYYAMRLIEGRGAKTLAQAISDRRDSHLDELLNQLRAVCNTVAYAHANSVIHRDLKPANILLGPFGETFVIDWGLAKEIPPSSITNFLSSTNPLENQKTTSGDSTDLVGTPGFLAPELLESPEAFSPQSDIYALGAILRRVCIGDPTKEADRIESLDDCKGIHPALVAICHKAMATNPIHRYASAKEMAEDLNRFLSGTPPRAWGEPLSYRLVRWRKRYRLFLDSTLFAFGLCSFVLGGILALQHRNTWTLERQAKILDRSLDSEADYRRRAIAQTERSNQREKLALEAIDAFRAEILQSPVLRNTEKYGNLRRSLLKHPTELYAKLSSPESTENELSPIRKEQITASRLELALLQEEGGSLQTALDTLLKLNDDLRSDLPEPSAITQSPSQYQTKLFHLAKTLHGLARIHSKVGDSQESKRFFSESEQWLQLLEKVDHPTPAMHLLLMEQEMVRAMSAAQEKNRNVAERRWRAALERLRLAETITGPTIEYDLRRQKMYNDYGLIHLRTGDLRRAKETYEELIARMADHEPATEPNYRYHLGAAHFNLGVICNRQGDKQSAWNHHQSSLDVRLSLAQEYASVTEFQVTLRHSYLAIAELTKDRDGAGASIKATKKALEICRELVARMPENKLHWGELATLLHQLGHTYSELGEIQLALDVYQEACPILSKILEDSPSDRSWRSQYAEILQHLGYLNLSQYKLDLALSYLERALPRIEDLVKSPGAIDREKQLLSNTLLALAFVQRKLGNDHQTQQHHQRLIQLDAKDPSKRRLDALLSEYQRTKILQTETNRLELADHALRRQDLQIAFELYKDAITKSPELIQSISNPAGYRAACSALLLCDLVPERADELRDQAYEWLTGQLNSWKESVELNPQVDTKPLNGWAMDPELGPVRCDRELEKLNDSQKFKWRQLWETWREIRSVH